MAVQTVGFRRYVLLAMAIFLYTLVVSALIQFFLLPEVFPAWHAGNGLLAGTDMPYYHQLATDLAQHIEQQGWSVWELRPVGQATAGIAGALYVLVAPEPWTMIPIYAALHALAGVLLVRILLYFDPRWSVAIVGALPLVLFPSAATWYSQLGKDGFSMAGYLAIVLGWLTLARLRTEPRPRIIVSGIFLILGGAGLVWVVRPFAVEILWVLSGLAAVVVTIALIQRTSTTSLPWRWAASGTVAAWLTFIAMLGLVPVPGVAESPQSQFVPSVRLPSVPDITVAFAWSRTAWLPDPLDDRFHSLAEARYGFTTGYPDAGSNIDVGTVFHQAADVVGYIPRAATIAFLLPSPIQWLEEGTLPQNTLMRRIAGLEMAGVYLALIMLPYAIWRWRGQLETWLLLLFSTGMILVLALVIANLGTLYRMRYPYLMSLVGLSVAAVTAALLDRRARVPNAEIQASQN